jgi:hypothetical protein
MLHKSGGQFFFQFSHVAPKMVVILFSIFSCCTKSGGHSFFNFLMLHQKWWSFFFQFFSHCTKSGGKLQEALVKSDYKTNKEIKKSRNSITCWQTTRT